MYVISNALVTRVCRAISWLLRLFFNVSFIPSYVL